MSNEEKNTQTCLCKSECFKKFVLTVAATFIGAYCALSLFMAIHRPPCPPQMPPMPPMPQQAAMAPQGMPPHNMTPPKGPDFGKMDKKFPPRPQKAMPEQTQHIEK